MRRSRPPRPRCLTETNAALTTAGEITFSDADAGDQPTASLGAQTVTSTVDADGSADAAIKTGLVLSADGSWTFKLASPDYLPEGAKIVLVSTVTVSDGKGGTASQDVTITIDGANDAPVIGPPRPNGSPNDVAVSDRQAQSVSGRFRQLTDSWAADMRRGVFRYGRSARRQSRPARPGPRRPWTFNLVSRTTTAARGSAGVDGDVTDVTGSSADAEGHPSPSPARTITT